MNKITEGKKYCYRYVDINDDKGRAVVFLLKRVIIRETEKTFWHVDDMPNMTLEQLIKYRTGGNKERQRIFVKRCMKGADRSTYHCTKEEALRAFVYRKMYQLERLQLTEETVRLCLDGLRNSGHISEGSRCAIAVPPETDEFLAAQEPGPIASTYTWGEY
ncbi:TPA: hypothetical protein QHL93_002558 [Klebsiella aerogenes]|nr:hypothetical protein [Klebsiella aerogenes]